MRKITLYVPEDELDGAALAETLWATGSGEFSVDGDVVRAVERAPRKPSRNFIDDMAEAEARHKRDGFDLQWCATEGHSLAKEYQGSWKPIFENISPAHVRTVVIMSMMLCERPSGANAEARHAAEQKSRDRVAAALAQYQHADSIHDIAITRHIGSKEEFAELMDELDEKERK